MYGSRNTKSPRVGGLSVGSSGRVPAPTSMRSLTPSSSRTTAPTELRGSTLRRG